jgi:hypothetical protein
MRARRALLHGLHRQQHGEDAETYPSNHLRAHLSTWLTIRTGTRVHEALKFGDPFDSGTVEGKREWLNEQPNSAAQKAEIEVLRGERP